MIHTSKLTHSVEVAKNAYVKFGSGVDNMHWKSMSNMSVKYSVVDVFTNVVFSGSELVR